MVEGKGMNYFPALTKGRRGVCRSKSRTGAKIGGWFRCNIIDDPT